MKRHNVILESNVEPKDNNVLWLQGNKLKKFGNTGWENIIEGDVVTTDRIENGAVTTDKIATDAFDSTLSKSEKIAPANIVGNKITTLDEKVDALALGKFYGYFPDSTSFPTDVSIPGYAYVRLDNSYKIWNFSGESWSDSGVSIDENDVIITTDRIEDGAVTTGKLEPFIQSLITNISKNASFAGIATPTTNPGTQDGPVFYFAFTPGIYSNFSGIELTEGETAILQWNNGTWTKKVTGIATQEKFTELKQEITAINNLGFEQGTLDAKGLPISSHSPLHLYRVRTKMLKNDGGKVINPLEDTVLYVYYYNSAESSKVTFTDYASGDIELLDYPYFRLIARKTDNSNISPFDVARIQYDRFTPKSTSTYNINSLFKVFEVPVIPAQNSSNPDKIFDLASVTVQELYDEIDNIVNNSHGYITKTILGKDQSDTYDIIKLELKNNANAVPPRKVLFDANVHNGEGDSIDACFTLIWLCKFLSENYKTNEVARFIRNNYHIIMIPLANPWGLANKTYGNSRSVNINRNYDYNFVPNKQYNYNTTSGSSAFSEKETQYIRDMLLENRDAYFWMDLHSYGNGMRKKVFYEVANDSFTFNLNRAKIVFSHTQNMIDGVEVQYFENFDSNGWGPAYGAKVLKMWSPNLECGNATTSGSTYSSDALTSDFYDLLGFMMFLE